MQKVLNIYKPVGKTPLDVIHEVRNKYPELQKVKLGYAGRLDPMAEGVLVVLIGDECKRRKEYEQLVKQYEFEVLIGVATDTYDVLGLITESISHEQHISDEDFKHILELFHGEHTQQYPPYSSARVQGKPLFYWARNNKLDEITVPQKTIYIEQIKVLSSYTLPATAVLQKVKDKISSVNGQFRQEEIMQRWQEKTETLSPTLSIFKCFIQCSSGTYVRSIANEAGKHLHIPALAFRIKRVSVGTYEEKDSEKLW